MSKMVPILNQNAQEYFNLGPKSWSQNMYWLLVKTSNQNVQQNIWFKVHLCMDGLRLLAYDVFGKFSPMA
jgi:hypothetical protein